MAAPTGCSSSEPAAPAKPTPAEKVGTGRAALSYDTTHTFHGGTGDGAIPTEGGVTVVGDTIYGTTSRGGEDDAGTIYKVAGDGSTFTILHSFHRTNPRSNPAGSLTVDGDTIYGATWGDGADGAGTLYKIKTDGSGFATIHEFENGVAYEKPAGSLVLVGGALFGTTSGLASLVTQGVIFKIGTDGSGYTELHTFGVGQDAWHPDYGLTLSGSTLYGATLGGGTASRGTLFKIDTDGTGYAVLHSFDIDGVEGRSAATAPVVDGSTIYATTLWGGANDKGTLVRIGTDGSGFRVLRSFDGWTRGPLAFSGSALYGCAGQPFRMSLDGAQLTFLIDPIAKPWNPGGCDGGLTRAGTTLYMTRQSGANDEGALFALDDSVYSIGTDVETDDVGVPTGTLTCTPSSWIAAGGTSTCTVTPAAGRAMRKLIDNGVDVRAQVQNGTYTIANIRTDHELVAAFGIAAGAACGGTETCAVGSCVDGVCCDRACDGQCESCAVPGHVGTCTLVTGAAAPGRAACASDGSACSGACDGRGAACVYPGAETACRAASCANGVATEAASCSGVGTCPAVSDRTCIPYACGGSTCETTCAGDADCASGHVCRGQACVVAEPVDAGPDAETPDASSDAAQPDAAIDAAGPDATIDAAGTDAALDAASPDAADPDAASPDAALDAASSDAASPDAALDAASPDAALDAAGPDAAPDAAGDASVDAGGDAALDAGLASDASPRDASPSDAAPDSSGGATADAATIRPDATPDESDVDPSVNPDPGCSCSETGRPTGFASPVSAFALALVVLRVRRRRSSSR
jgi:uncharacterized repeat protein (TIGR03803 family)